MNGGPSRKLSLVRVQEDEEDNWFIGLLFWWKDKSLNNDPVGDWIDDSSSILRSVSFVILSLQIIWIVGSHGLLIYIKINFYIFVCDDIEPRRFGLVN